MIGDGHMLIRARIIPPKGKTYDVFNLYYEDILEDKEKDIALCMRRLWDKFEDKSIPSLNGKVFECLFAAMLFKCGVQPIHTQAKVTFVPNVEFDYLLYTREYGPVSLSMKTSLRERYKQAELEASALKNIHRNSKCYLVTLNKKEAKNLSEKIKKGIIWGLDAIYVATEPEINKLMTILQNLNIVEPSLIRVITSTKTIATPAREAPQTKGENI